MKHFFNKLLWMHPRLVLCFFFAMSGTPLVASQSFESSPNTRPITKLYPCDSIVFHQGEDNNFDILDDREKKLLLDGYAGEKESKVYIEKSYKKSNHAIVNIPNTEWFANLKPVKLNPVRTELLLYGFLSTGKKELYIPKDILQTLALFLHDCTILDKTKQAQDILKKQIKIVTHDIADKIERKRREERFKEDQLRFTCGFSYLLLNLICTVYCIVEFFGEHEDVFFYAYLASLFSIGDIYLLVWIIRREYC